MGIDLMTNKAVPIGFDYSCALGHCEKVFRSFSGVQSLQITEKLTRLLDPYNLLNQSFTQQNKIIDTIGIGLSK